MVNSNKRLQNSIGGFFKNNWIKRVVSVSVSLVAIILIYSKIDISSVFRNIREANLLDFSLFLLSFLPIFYITALRWHLIACAAYKVNFSKNFMLYMAIKPLNIVSPLKMGEIAKPYFIVKSNLTNVTDAVDLVVIEKTFDMLTLCLFLIVSTFIFEKYKALNIMIIIIAAAFLFSYLLIVALNSFIKGSGKFTCYLKRIPLGLNTLKKLKNDNKLILIILLSIASWFLHFTQFLFLFRTMNSPLEIGLIYTLVPVAVFAGLAPFTIAGIGIRDAALLTLFSGMETPSVIAAVGALSSLRSFIPALLGLPFLYALGKNNFKFDNKS